MKKQTFMCNFLLLVACFVFVGCAGKNADQLALQEAALQAAAAKAAAEKSISDDAVVISSAESMLGVRYKYGGTTTKGFDCSGFVQWAFAKAGVKLPRTARDQSRAGESVKKQELQVGDIVTFRHPRIGYHTGIYLGDGKFIHSPRRNKDIQVSDLATSYFSRNYLGARRVFTPSKAEIAAAEELLANYEKEHTTTKKK